MGYGILAVALASVLATASAQSQTLYGQCGGSTYTGPTSCAAGSYCSTQNPYYAQCTPNAAATTTTMTTIASTGGGGGGGGSGPSQTLYGQCGGTTYTGPTACPTGAYCSTQGPYYAQCVTGTSTGGGSPPVTTTTTTSTTTSKPVSSSTPTATSSPTPISGLVSYAGVNIAGCDFGCDTSGTCSNNGYVCPTSVGPTQMTHFTNDDHLNIYRLPVGWQYLVANNLGGTLDPNFFSTYNGIVQACLNTGAKCIVDVHNYARWNGGIIGQGGPTNAQFASLWSQLATKYAGNSNVVFGIMNEPHDLNMTQWAGSVQAAVTAIRNAGATSQWILLPGTSYTAAGGFQTNSAPYLASVTNTDGSTKNLIYDIHQYMDSDGSGTHSTCVTDHVSDAFTPLATYLRQNGRQALLSETGGGNTQSCVQYVCSALSYLNSNSDVYLGWVGWAAGSFDTNYVLTETPNGSQDQLIVSQCIAGKF